MTANLDRNLATVLGAIDGAELRDSTIFVFTSDHGEMFGAHGRRGKNIFHEEAIRVPFLLRWPGSVPAGLVSDACLNTPDILPTLLTMMNLPVPDEVEGVDLSHCAAGRAGSEPETAFLQGMGCTAAWEDGHEWRAVRSKRHTYAVYRRDRRELLFDNQSDPYQTRDLANDPDHARTLRSLRSVLKERMAEYSDTFEACTWYRDNWTRNRCIVRSATMG
jgi:arylsulfatase A-like enzyme